jgi:stringent starvation protein B
MEEPLIPVKSYFLRAFFDWIVDNGWTPQILVDATKPAVNVPQEYVKDGQIVLNISPKAVRKLEMDAEAVSFNTRFGTDARNIYVPMPAILAVYAQENNQMLTFPAEPEPTGAPGTDGTPPRPGPRAVEPKPKAKRPNLRVVKD